ncbi:hypothetical protein ABZN20_14840 [Methylococcus sp. ANG]|uniref:hypothetical protein n=1 Tax=Methylococcus TaxID=413 RepID=UPI001C52B1C8|nr:MULTISPECIES: hypothetical protein [Methylococcus]MDD2768362.1 hypothetical protein [Methylococcus sp.]QXP85039.1 hypothetical protein KW115_04710 [Methylococcus sp. Mc7]UZR27264.1 hypothetical protein OOT43_11005 [Methylococcus mesophilus]
MTVEQLIQALQEMPKNAVVLYEGDAGYALVGGVGLQQNGNGVPDEAILFPDMNE